MIVSMAKVRVMGPRERLRETLRALQELEVLHLARAEPEEGVRPVEPEPDEAREPRQLRRLLEDVEWMLARLTSGGAAARAPGPGERPEPDRERLARWARRIRDLRREVEGIVARRERAEAEHARVTRYHRYFTAFEELAPALPTAETVRPYYVVLRGEHARRPERVRSGLEESLGDGFEMLTAPLGEDELAAVLVVAAGAAREVDRALSEAGVEELSLPQELAGENLESVVSGLEGRGRELADELDRARAELRGLASEHLAFLRRVRAALRDRLLELEALEHGLETEHAFVLEGWVPEASLGILRDGVREELGGEVVVERIAREEWRGEEAPVVLSNPRLFQPFEVLTSLLPLPRYGTIDPTPFVAVFFPLFFGIALGDVGYGLALAGVALLLHRRAETGGTLDAVAKVAGACAAFTVVFGLLYGELLGDLGRRWLGMEALGLNREEALPAFLVFAVALGLLHVLLGLVLGAVASFRSHPRTSAGRGLSALMLVLITVAILAAARVLPGAFFTPAVVALLVAFPLLVVLEGILGPVELLSSLGNVLSYARIMAIGTASVVMAVVANRMVGAVGGALVGALFGLLFHLVNFALGVFGPAVHVLRLHYVEFFGKFYSPGGTEYRPFGPWRPDRTRVH